MVQTCANAILRNIRDVHKSLSKGELTVTNLCNESLKLIDRTKNLNVFITVFRDEVMEKASQLDKGSACDKNNNDNNNKRSMLSGIPISIKDNFCTQDALTTCGSKMLHNFVAPYNATVVFKLLQADSIVVGKTNMDEFAMGSSCTTSYYGPTANCWKSLIPQDDSPSSADPQQWYMAGGSSTGSAVSVASGSSFASLTTDTGGSTRQPASLTGIVGFKPTYGLISRFGLIPLANSLDVVSVMARQVDDVRIVFNAVVGQDEGDLTSVDHNRLLTSSFRKLDKSNSDKVTIRIGIPEEFVLKGDVSEDVMEHYDKILSFLSSGNIDDRIKFELVKLNLPYSSLATECYTIISSAEIASNMSCYDGVKYGFSNPQAVCKAGGDFNRDYYFRAVRDEGFGAEVKKRVLLGNYFLLEENRDKYLMQALKVRRLISEEFNRAFNENGVSIILTPSTPSTSFTYDQWLKRQDNNKLFHEDYFLIPSNLANLPSISLPGAISRKGLPIGFQLISNKYHDLDLLSISELFESRLIKAACA